ADGLLHALRFLFLHPREADERVRPEDEAQELHFERRVVGADVGVEVLPALLRSEHALPPPLPRARADGRRAARQHAGDFLSGLRRRIFYREPRGSAAADVGLSERLFERAVAYAPR